MNFNQQTWTSLNKDTSILTFDDWMDGSIFRGVLRGKVWEHELAHGHGDGAYDI